jgi:hypothetical protein
LACLLTNAARLVGEQSILDRCDCGKSPSAVIRPMRLPLSFERRRWVVRGTAMGAEGT